MQSGKILVAEQDGSHILKLLGDVRLTMCTALDEHFEAMFAHESFINVLVDLSDADNVDSTTLGMLAKLAIKANQARHEPPVLLSTNPDITRILESMGFDRIFHIRNEPLTSDDDLGELPPVADSEAKIRERVLDAHRILMGLCSENEVRFQDLVETLQSDV